MDWLGLMNSSYDFQSIHVINFVISLHSILLVDIESGSKYFTKYFHWNQMLFDIVILQTKSDVLLQMWP
jgi:hypothetical protein